MSVTCSSTRGFILILDPITRKRLQRFREYKRAYYSLLIIAFLYATSLVAEVFCNDRPLYVSYEGESYFPVLFFYPEDDFTGNGLLTRPDYKAIAASAAFSENPDNYMIFPLIPFGPHEIISASSIPVGNEVEIQVRRAPRVASVNIDPGFIVRREQRATWFFPQSDRPVTGRDIRSAYEFPAPFIEALELRFANQPAGPYSGFFGFGPDAAGVELSLSPYRPRSKAPETVRILLREVNLPSSLLRPSSSFPRTRESSETGGRPTGDTVSHWMPGQARHDEERTGDTVTKKERATQYPTGCRVKPGMTKKERATQYSTGCRNKHAPECCCPGSGMMKERLKPRMTRVRLGSTALETAKSRPPAGCGMRFPRKPGNRFAAAPQRGWRTRCATCVWSTTAWNTV